MSELPRLKPADKWIFAMIALAPVAILLATRLAHTHQEIPAGVYFFCVSTLLWALPSIVGTHIYYNASRTPNAILWVESILVGVLLMLGTQTLALNIFGDTAASILSLSLGVSFALLPLFSRNRHQNP
ncbi:MAG: hypothetical protein ABSC71_11900 [Candidatus Acidiferrales bacterium]|jgi:hypothetical protein